MEEKRVGSKKIPDIKVEVKSVKGKCALGHKVGDVFYFRGGTTPAELCVEAMLTVIPTARTLMFEGTHFWVDDPDAIEVCCPDPVNLLVFEVRRLRKA